MKYSFEPIDVWPRKPTISRRRAPFRVGYEQSLTLLGKELESLGARQAIVQAAFRDYDIRLDGLPRSDTRQPMHPGIIVCAKTKFGDLKWVCDEFDRWQSNVRAIALTLERLRLADMYGVTKRGEQYSGWKQLPGPIIVPAAMTFDQAAEVVMKHSGRQSPPPFGTDFLRDCYREAAKRLHPDPNGGKHLPAWAELQAAKAVIDSIK